MFISKRGLSVGIAGLALGMTASAVDLALFNTGVDDSNALLALGASDTHWSVVAGPGVTTPFPAVVVNNQNPFGVYAQDSDSRWVWIDANGSGSTGSPYTFRLTFDLTGLDPSTASISGKWAADNGGTMMMNGAPVIGTGTVSSTHGSFTDFTITGGFVVGVNMLDFVVIDAGNPGGLNVTDLVGTAAVPEPAAIVALAGGALALLRRRRRG